MKPITIIVVFAVFLMAVPFLRADIVGTTDKQIKALADPFLDSILKGFAEDLGRKNDREVCGLW